MILFETAFWAKVKWYDHRTTRLVFGYYIDDELREKIERYSREVPADAIFVSYDVPSKRGLIYEYGDHNFGHCKASVVSDFVGEWDDRLYKVEMYVSRDWVAFLPKAGNITDQYDYQGIPLSEVLNPLPVVETNDVHHS